MRGMESEETPAPRYRSAGAAEESRETCLGKRVETPREDENENKEPRTTPSTLTGTTRETNDYRSRREKRPEPTKAPRHARRDAMRPHSYAHLQ
ncbi:unnamed protein product [Pleuronectes platessa]|uniref:Uncharacterized protein n=1 Tax=Pleuronectes platessa TaxID=8262 RepID=A0A9N7TSR9_PLEPL|nr:unnamed protein product [Pleuronectes platessa]